MDNHSIPDLIVTPRGWTLSTRKRLRKRSGVYAYFLGNIPLYVGATNNLEARLAVLYWQDGSCSNRLLRIIIKAEKSRIRAKIFFHDEKDLVVLEKKYMEKIQPRLNQQNRVYNRTR